MKTKIDRDGCIGCGLCVSLCPEVYRMADDDRAEVFVDTVPMESESAVLNASASCPVSVISVE